MAQIRARQGLRRETATQPDLGQWHGRMLDQPARPFQSDIGVKPLWRGRKLTAHQSLHLPGSDTDPAREAADRNRLLDRRFHDFDQRHQFWVLDHVAVARCMLLKRLAPANLTQLQRIGNAIGHRRAELSQDQSEHQMIGACRSRGGRDPAGNRVDACLRNRVRPFRAAGRAFDRNRIVPRFADLDILEEAAVVEQCHAIRQDGYMPARANRLMCEGRQRCPLIAHRAPRQHQNPRAGRQGEPFGLDRRQRGFRSDLATLHRQKPQLHLGPDPRRQRPGTICHRGQFRQPKTRGQQNIDPIWPHRRGRDRVGRRDPCPFTVDERALHDRRPRPARSRPRRVLVNEFAAGKSRHVLTAPRAPGYRSGIDQPARPS